MTWALSDRERARSHQVLLDRVGIALAEHRIEPFEQALSCLSRRLNADIDETAARLSQLPLDNDLWQQIVGDITVGETSFFRHREWFLDMKEHILRPLIESRRTTDRRLRIWSAGCSTGDEAYSVAIVVHQLIGDLTGWDVSIIATDINNTALAVAKRATYKAWRLREVDDWARTRWFREAGKGEFALVPTVRNMVKFSHLNLAGHDYPNPALGLSDLDLILCRNVLIYFPADVQKAVISRLGRCLTPQGWLASGPIEIGMQNGGIFEPSKLGASIFFQAGAPRRRQTEMRSPVRSPHPMPQALPAVTDVAPPRSALQSAAKEPQAAAEPPSDARARREEALAWADSGNIAAARAAFETSLTVDGPSFDLYMLMALVLEEDTDLNAAADAVRNALYLEPESVEALFVQARLAFRLGRRDRARSLFRNVLAMVDRLPGETIVSQYTGASAATIRRLTSSYLNGAAGPSSMTETNIGRN